VIIKQHEFKHLQRIFFVILMIVSVVSFSSVLNVSGFQGDEPLDPVFIPPTRPTGWADNAIEVSLSGSGITYERQTFVEVASPTDPTIFLWSAVVELTTHSDLLVQIRLHFDPDEWNNNFQTFLNSPRIQNDYFNNSKAFNDLLRVPIDDSFFGISSRSFRTINDVFFNQEENKPESTFVIEERIVLRETSAFILALNEPFPFDLNNIQLGTLTNFRYEILFETQGTTSVTRESVKLSSAGGPLELNSKTSGYSGTIAFSQFDTQELGNYSSPNVEGGQILAYTIELPSGQEIDSASTSFDTEFTTRLANQDEGFEELDMESQSNFMWFWFETGDLVPQSVSFQTAPPVIPIFEQFSTTDYLSFGASGLIGLLTVFKGLPAYLHYRSSGKFRSKLARTMRDGKHQEFQAIQDDVFNKFSSGKLSLRQYNDVTAYANAIEQGFKGNKSN